MKPASFPNKQGSEDSLTVTVFEYSPSEGILFKGRRIWILVWSPGNELDFFFPEKLFRLYAHKVCRALRNMAQALVPAKMLSFFENLTHELF